VSGLDRLWAGWRSEYVTSFTDEAGATSPARAASEPAATEPAATEPAASEPLSEAPAGEDPARSCVFCRILASGADDRDTHIVWRHPSGLIVALLNAYPYASGHLLVLPTRHTADLESLEPAEAAALWGGVTDGVRAIQAAYRPDGLNIGANLGKAAGAGVPGHLHVHVLPRWSGDSNFMTSVAEARVLPEALPVTDDKLRRAWTR
jgi:diadenosine tetraphosphate (Ap4A) HIT family hydrolase